MIFLHIPRTRRNGSTRESLLLSSARTLKSLPRFVVRLILIVRPVWLWLLNLALFAVLLTWAFLDPLLDETFRQLPSKFGLLIAGGKLTEVLDSRLLLLCAIGATVALINSALFAGLIWGSPKRRALKSWLAFASILCFWLAVWSNWPSIAWWAKQQRLDGYVPEFEAAAQELRENWPTSDGYLAATGPFMAYPVSDPSVLILLTLPKLSLPGTSFSAVERDDFGSLRFELVGKEQGAWVEWHPPGRHPESFEGGLCNWHELDRYSALRDGWYLARYVSHDRVPTGVTVGD